MPRLYVGRLNQRVTEKDLERMFDEYGKIRDIMMKGGYAFLDFEDQRDAEDACYDLNGKDLHGDRILVELAKGFERGMGGRPLADGGTRRGRDGRGRGRENVERGYSDRGKGDHGDRDRGDRDREERDRGDRDRGDRDRGDRDRGDRDRGDRDRGDRDRGDRYGNSDLSDSIANRKQHARDKYGPPVRTKWQIRIDNLSSRVSWQDLKDYVRPHADVTYAEAHRKERGVGTLCLATKDDLDKVIRTVNGVELNGKKVTVIDITEASRSRSRSRSPRRSRSRSPHRSRSQSRSRSRSRSKSRPARSKSKSHSRSKSPARSPNRSASRSLSRSRSRSKT